MLRPCSETCEGLAFARVQSLQVPSDCDGRRRGGLPPIHLQRVRSSLFSCIRLQANEYSSHPSVYLDRIAHEDSTSNLLRHVRTCEPPETAETEVIMSFAAGSTYSKAKFRYLLAIWCARRHRPFSVVEDPEFREVVRMLYGRAEIPSRISVSRDIQHLLEYSRVRLINKLLVRRWHVDQRTHS